MECKSPLQERFIAVACIKGDSQDSYNWEVIGGSNRAFHGLAIPTALGIMCKK